MGNRRRVISVLFGLLVFTASVHADMLSMTWQNDECLRSPRNINCVNLQCENTSSTYNSICIDDLDEWPIEFLDKANTDIGQDSRIQHIKGLTNGPNSLNFCLSALISFGLCCSTRYMKKMSLSFVPEWYHDGGPFQIGHSHAVMPGTLRLAQAYCFIQPDCKEDNPLTQYFIKSVISLWRKSQFTPVVLASRGPPDMS
jgi:hypothetical protein